MAPCLPKREGRIRVKGEEKRLVFLFFPGDKPKVISKQMEEVQTRNYSHHPGGSKAMALGYPVEVWHLA